MNICIFAQINGNIEQEIKLNEDFRISESEFINGLNSGKFATTVSHNAEMKDCGLVIQTSPEFKIIGKVIYQCALDDLEITDFEIHR